MQSVCVMLSAGINALAGCSVSLPKVCTPARPAATLQQICRNFDLQDDRPSTWLDNAAYELCDIAESLGQIDTTHGKTKAHAFLSSQLSKPASSDYARRHSQHSALDLLMSRRAAGQFGKKIFREGFFEDLPLCLSWLV